MQVEANCHTWLEEEIQRVGASTFFLDLQVPLISQIFSQSSICLFSLWRFFPSTIEGVDFSLVEYNIGWQIYLGAELRL